MDPKTIALDHASQSRRRFRLTNNAFSNSGILLSTGRLVYARTSLRFFKDVFFISLAPAKTIPNIRPIPAPIAAICGRFGSDGAYIPGFSGAGANVKPGESFTYRFEAGSGAKGVWPYHDHSPSMMESIDGGMYGALSVLGATLAIFIAMNWGFGVTLMTASATYLVGLAALLSAAEPQ